MNILVTGANGFVGSAVVNNLSFHAGFTPRAAVRRENHHLSSVDDVVQVSSLTSKTNWDVALQGVSVIIHTAARVHIMKDHTADPLNAFREINVEGSLNLARQAAEAGVGRFIFISSIKVNGELTFPGRPFTESDTPAPIDPYGISKFEAEEGLRRISKVTGMEVVIIRPVLVYGPGVKGNFFSMMRWLKKGIPLPLGSINNLRSLVALDNLISLIITCVDHPSAANQTFLVSDNEDISTSKLLKRMSFALNTPARLIPVPSSWLELAASVLRKKELAQRLCSSLQVDISKTQTLLGWKPVVGVDEVLRQTAKHFLGHQAP